MLNIVKNTTLPNFLDLIAPHSCRGCGRLGNVLCNRCKKNIITNHIKLCPFCKNSLNDCNCKNRPNYPPVFIVDRRQSIMGTLIQELKYNSIRAIAPILAEILDSVLPNFQNPVVIVPLPTISQHIRKRGLDHTFLISKHLAKIRGKNYQVSRLLLRANNTVQVGSNRSERLKQADAAYRFNPKSIIKPNTTYLLLDDIWTTGASIKSAIKKLRLGGVNDIAVAILALS
ncbi:ComF family protein [Candidatus Saccharibacteria bacterium]|nr:ComF family protein [Candidatus Saccharibacteria bacterium]